MFAGEEFAQRVTDGFEGSVAMKKRATTARDANSASAGAVLFYRFAERPPLGLGVHVDVERCKPKPCRAQLNGACRQQACKRST